MYGVRNNEIRLKRRFLDGCFYILILGLNIPEAFLSKVLLLDTHRNAISNPTWIKEMNGGWAIWWGEVGGGGEKKSVETKLHIIKSLLGGGRVERGGTNSKL